MNFNIEGQNEQPNIRRKNSKKKSMKVSYGFTPMNRDLLKNNLGDDDSKVDSSKGTNRVIKNKSKFEQMVKKRKIINFDQGKQPKSTYKKIIMIKENIKSPSLKELDLPSQKQKNRISFLMPENNSPKSSVSAKQSNEVQDQITSIKSGIEDDESSDNEISKSFHQNAKKWKSFAMSRSKSRHMSRINLPEEIA